MSLPECYRCGCQPCRCSDGATLLQGDCLRVMATLPERHYHVCVTSPPYFALRSYLPADHPDKALEIGSETTSEAFVATMVEVFRQVWRVLRDDGVLFLNLGDSYAGSGRGGDTGLSGLEGSTTSQDQSKIAAKRTIGPGLKPKDLCNVPHRVVLALQEDGWFHRDTIIWQKPSPMPGSQRDRCTSSYEFVFQLTKRPTYYWDMESIKESGKYGFTPKPGMYQRLGNADTNPERTHLGSCPDGDGGTRIPRNVWTIASEGYSAAHFATFPRALPEKCIKAATSEKGCCPECGTPWVRVTDSERVRTRPGTHSKSYDKITGETVDDGVEKPWRDRAEIGNRDPGRHVTATRTVGWESGCHCRHDTTFGAPFPPVPCRVLDPFAGAGTTGLAAIALQRHCTLIELAEDYCDQIVKRLRDGLYARPTKRTDAAGQMQMFESTH